MLSQKPALYSLLTHTPQAVLLVLVSILSFKAIPAQAGNGPTVDIPPSNIIPIMDGVCDPSEYNDAIQVSITVGMNNTFPIFMKRTANNAYFCFGDSNGLPLPLDVEDTPEVTVYIDRDNDGFGNDSNDFGVWMPYTPGGSPRARYWGNNNYNGPDPGGWQAVKHQTPDLWQVEFSITRETIGGWNHTVGLALFYHWWRWQSDDFSWPMNGIWASPQNWGNGRFATGSVHIGFSATHPMMDGLCNITDYSDASTINFTLPGDGGVITSTAYLEHSSTDLYACLSNLIIPSVGLEDERNAALYIDRSGTGGGAPGEDDLLFTISYTGTVQANSGDGAGFTGPDPGGYVIVRAQHDGVWDAEFQISGATIERWYSRSIGLAVSEQNVITPGDYYGWPTGFAAAAPNSWGVANLIELGKQLYLPALLR